MGTNTHDLHPWETIQRSTGAKRLNAHTWFETWGHYRLTTCHTWHHCLFDALHLTTSMRHTCLVSRRRAAAAELTPLRSVRPSYRLLRPRCRENLYPAGTSHFPRPWGGHVRRCRPPVWRLTVIVLFLWSIEKFCDGSSTIVIFKRSSVPNTHYWYYF